jgi:hypothetical protein
MALYEILGLQSILLYYVSYYGGLKICAKPMPINEFHCYMALCLIILKQFGLF